MNSATTTLIQSKYYTPVFNTAIFDGPVRMYFAQHQESDALKMYFHLQETVAQMRDKLEKFDTPSEPNLFLMLYPNEETYFQSFENKDQTSLEKMGSHFVIGIQGPLREETLSEAVEKVSGVMAAWQDQWPSASNS